MMPKPMLAVGVDPAKRVHPAIAVPFPDNVVLDVELPNAAPLKTSTIARLTSGCSAELWCTGSNVAMAVCFHKCSALVVVTWHR